MAPKRAAKEELVSEAIQLREENVNRLARFGEEYQLNEAFRKAALRKILTGKGRDQYEHWQAEKLSFDDLLRRVKEQARSHMLDADVSNGNTGIAAGANNTRGPTENEEEPNLEPQGASQADVATDINAVGQQSRGYKGKGKGAKGCNDKGA
ncbi:hypothetical protein N9L19_01025 [bacterium]|nr:hypothetical protein [bacterium]